VVRLLSKTQRVIGTVRDAAQAAAVRAQVPAIAEVVELDLGNNEQLSRGLQGLAEDATDLAGVVVCAAVCPNGPVETASVEVLRNTLEVNLISHVTIFQRCMPALRRTQGRLIFTSSYSGQVGLPFTGLYVASKFALEGIADVMRREVSKFGVEVILIEPGGLKTKMVTRQIAELRTALATLSPLERQLYGDLYRQFLTLADRAFPAATPPEEAARVIALALRVRKPKTRYAVGADAKQLLAMNAVRADRAMDKICLDIFAAVDRTA
jgi:NAD(P)-dependent dehydrogenase (short-subunit alcohol dehydrogenase family)